MFSSLCFTISGGGGLHTIIIIPTTIPIPPLNFMHIIINDPTFRFSFQGSLGRRGFFSLSFTGWASSFVVICSPVYYYGVLFFVLGMAEV
jgi:hypothetical protein